MSEPRREEPIVHPAPGQDWMAVVRNNGTQEFAAAFSDKPEMENLCDDDAG